jgi:hypothetical protein
VLAGILFGATLLPSTANADHGWTQRNDYWLYYNVVDGARQWYWFDTTPGQWLYWNNGRWDYYGPYRPPYVIIDDDAYGFLPRSYWNSPQFYVPPANVLRTLEPARYGHYLQRGLGHDIGRGRGHDFDDSWDADDFFRGNPGRGRGNAFGQGGGAGRGRGRGPK